LGGSRARDRLDRAREEGLRPTSGAYGRWFAGAVVNTCYNALDRHVAGGRAGQVALIHDSPLTNSITKFTYAEMLGEVKTLAAVMQDFGVTKGDRVILYMPLVPEAVIAMLACARIGAVHSVVFGGFAAKELATRIDDAKPKADLLGKLRPRARPHRAIQATA
jgi:propionyl-CoA synthetase